MRHIIWLLSLVSSLALAAGLCAEEKKFVITGTVGTVGANLGTEIDGASPVFANRDAFEIVLRFDTNQTPSISPAGVGQTASYRLLETTISIFGDNATFSWGTTQNSVSHSFGVTNNFFGGADWFTSGGALLGITGSLLGPGNKAFDNWDLNFTNNAGTYFTNTDIPTTMDFNAFIPRTITLVFDGFMTADTITLNTTGIQVLAVPEPSTWAVILGAGALGVAAWRRRRRAPAA
jgi:hypothetical protein